MREHAHLYFAIATFTVVGASFLGHDLSDRIPISCPSGQTKLRPTPYSTEFQIVSLLSPCANWG